MNYLKFLTKIHAARGDIDLYLEIGCRRGRSLSLSTAKSSVAVDPDFNIVFPFTSPTRIFKMTSDDFFEAEAAQALHSPVELAFIDGMHLSEFALRDFMNVEKHASPDGWILFDDVLPSDISFATRTRHTKEWTGDIYKLIDVLRRYRPDLQVEVYDVAQKGIMLVRGLDPKNRALDAAYAEIEAELTRVDTPEVTVAQIRDIAQPIPPRAFANTMTDAG